MLYTEYKKGYVRYDTIQALRRYISWCNSISPTIANDNIKLAEKLKQTLEKELKYGIN